MSSSAKNAIKANLVDNALVVSSLSGKEPRVWRIDMGQFLSAALQIEEKQGEFSLMIKPGNGAAEEIGVFSDRKKAHEALQLVTDALLRGRENQPHSKAGCWFRKILKFALLLLVVLAVLVVWGKAHRPVNQNDVVNAPAVQTGVPTPADQMFGK